MYFAYKRFPAEHCPMNIFKLLAVFAVVSIAACTSDSSPSGAEPGENSSTEIPSSSASYGVVPVDTTIRDYVDPIEGMISSASKTSYNFSTERTILFDSTEIFVAAYFQDRAVQGFADRAGGSATFTYRLLKSADSGGDFVGYARAGIFGIRTGKLVGHRGFFAGFGQKLRVGTARTVTGKEPEIAPGFSHQIFPRSKISKLATNHFTLWSFE